MKLDSLEGMTILQMLILLNMLATAMALTRPARKTTPMNHRIDKRRSYQKELAVLLACFLCAVCSVEENDYSIFGTQINHSEGKGV